MAVRVAPLFLGTVNGPSNLTATQGTPIIGLVPPYPGRIGAGPFKQKVTGSNQQRGRGTTHINEILYTPGTTAHTITLARPFNFTWLQKAMAANSGGTSNDFKPQVDPGKYSTNYNYPLPGGVPAQVADDVMDANTYVVIQLDDGTWWLSKITSGTFAGNNYVLTTPLPNNTIGASIGNAVYYFGDITTDTNPQDGQANPALLFTQPGGSGSQIQAWSSFEGGLFSAYHPGDPLLVYSNNATAAGTLNSVSGYYALV